MHLSSLVVHVLDRFVWRLLEGAEVPVLSIGRLQAISLCWFCQWEQALNLFLYGFIHKRVDFGGNLIWFPRVNFGHFV